jgi:cellulose biosynthesis protein BcsQ
MHTFWVTFYSYKGGVGRSMALANVAAHLASRGRRVMMVDFDLEAPGLDAFSEFGVEIGCPGVVEYVSDYLATGVAPSIGNFVHEITPTTPLSGKLWLMTAGRKDHAYNRARAAIDWQDLYNTHQGSQLIENFKADVEDSLRPDYVFIDSRTGLTDIGGVCTLHLPDLVVLLFSLNEQNLVGVASVARVLRDSEKAPQLLPIASPVPNLAADSKSAINERYSRASELLGTEIPLSINYSSLASLKEGIFTWGSDSSLSKQYKELATKIASSDPAGLDYLLSKGAETIKAFDVDGAKTIAQTLKEEYPDRSDAWVHIAEIQQTTADPVAAEESLRTALKCDPANSVAFDRLNAVLRVKQRHGEIIDLVKWLLTSRGRLRPNSIENLETVAAESLMREQRYEEARKFYEEILSKATAAERSEVLMLAPHFNYAESGRRAYREIRDAEWRSVVKIFEAAAAGVSASSLPARMNQLQAIHVAYACIGSSDRAIELLTDVHRLAATVSPRERLFSVALYEYVSKDEFMRLNKEMKSSLEGLSQLWDGMAVPNSSERKPTIPLL